MYITRYLIEQTKFLGPKDLVILIFHCTVSLRKYESQLTVLHVKKKKFHLNYSLVYFRVKKYMGATFVRGSCSLIQ